MHFCFVRASESIRVQKYFNFLSQILHRMQNPTFVVKCVSHQIFAFFTTREEVKAVGLTREDTEVVTTAAAEITTHNNNNTCHNNWQRHNNSICSNSNNYNNNSSNSNNNVDVSTIVVPWEGVAVHRVEGPPRPNLTHLPLGRCVQVSCFLILKIFAFTLLFV